MGVSRWKRTAAESRWPELAQRHTAIFVLEEGSGPHVRRWWEGLILVTFKHTLKEGQVKVCQKGCWGHGMH